MLLRAATYLLTVRMLTDLSGWNDLIASNKVALISQVQYCNFVLTIPAGKNAFTLQKLPLRPFPQ